MHADGRMQRRRRLPGAIAHAGDEFADASGRVQRNGAAIDGDDVAVVVQPADLDLDALQRRIDIAHGAAGRALLAHHVPGLQRATQRQAHAARCHLAQQGEAELEVRREPGRIHRVTGLGQLVHHVFEVQRDEGRQQEAVVQLGAPARAAASRRAFARSAPPARAAAAAARGSSASAAASRRRAAPAGPAGRWVRRASTACRCRTRCGACCRSRRSGCCAARGRPATAGIVGAAAASAQFRAARSPARRPDRCAPRRRAAPGWSGR